MKYLNRRHKSIIFCVLLTCYICLLLFFQINFDNKEEDLKSLSEICNNIPLVPKIVQKSDFLVLYNYVQRRKKFKCHESITLTAPGDFRFLDNVIALVNYWDGPISIALHAPGDDFQVTLDSISYLRNCESDLIRSMVTFHIFFEEQHFPKKYQSLMDAYEDTYNCTHGPPYTKYEHQQTYKQIHKLQYPINVARNIARESVETYFVFPSDIELYPSKNFVSNFLDMIDRNRHLLNIDQRNVFVLPVFEVLKNASVPRTKTELLRMFYERKAFLFHLKLCSYCHRVPKFKGWLKTPETNQLDTFVAEKRTAKYWEPFYVGTQKEPSWDERQTWEGSFNKISQAHALCLLDYDFHVLNNAFIVHKPGIKTSSVLAEQHSADINRGRKLFHQIKREYKVLFGSRNNC